MKFFLCQSRIISFLLKNGIQFCLYFLFRKKKPSCGSNSGKGKGNDTKQMVEKRQFISVFLQTFEFRI